MSEWHFVPKLLDVDGNQISDTKVTARFYRIDNGQWLTTPDSVSVPPPPEFRLRILTGAWLRVQFTMEQHQQRVHTFRSPGEKATYSPELLVFRHPDQWDFDFRLWNNLDAKFDDLKQVLRRSSNIVLLKDRSGLAGETETIAQFVNDEFDRRNGEVRDMAKACLLNLYARLNRIGVPLLPGQSWFSLIDRIAYIARERFIATVNKQMYDAIHRIHKDRAFENYKGASHSKHKKNFPQDLNVEDLVSIKSKEDLGNLQLTLARGTDPNTNQSVFLLDADIDEHGDLFRHIGDVLKHEQTGGTNPKDIHEFLRMMHPHLELGYSLIRRTPL